jgi:hypothetical protein
MPKMSAIDLKALLSAERYDALSAMAASRGKLADRRRATAQDGCAGETYEKVEAANSGSR